MDRNSQRGQMMVEMFVLIAIFLGLFLTVFEMTQASERREQTYHFGQDRR